MKRAILVLLLLLPQLLTTQELTFQWDLLSTPRLQPLLVHTGLDGTVNTAEGSERFSETLGRVVFTLGGRKGRYQFFVVNPDADDDFSDWSAYVWLDYAEATFTQGNLKLQLQPQPGAGAVWHAVDFIGPDHYPVVVNLILPRRNAVYGQVFDAATGLTLANVQVEARTASDTLVRDVTNRRGLFLIFLPKGAYTLHFLSDRHQPIRRLLDTSSVVFPRQVDVSLGSVDEPNSYLLTLLWENYPEVIDFRVQEINDSGEVKTHAAAPKPGTVKTLRLQTVPPSTYRILLSPQNPEEARRFGFSGARVLVHGSDGLRTYTLPLGRDKKWEAALWTEPTGWIPTGQP